MIKEELLKNAKKLHLDTHQEVLDKIENEWHDIEKSLNTLKEINIDRVKPMSHPIEITTSFLRDDIPGEGAPKEIILNNAPQSDEDFILVNKVVKHD